jgi:hypothetical protein
MPPVFAQKPRPQPRLEVVGAAAPDPFPVPSHFKEPIDISGILGRIDSELGENEALSADELAVNPGSKYVPALEILKKLGIDPDTLTHEQVFQKVRERQSSQVPVGRSEEDGKDDSWIKNQEYSYSDHLIGIVGRKLGALALKLDQQYLISESEVFDLMVDIVSLKDQYETSIIEMIQTHPPLREKLEINYLKLHLVHGGSVMALDGKTKMSSMIRRGFDKATLEAEEDERMLPLARRCGADDRWQERAESMPVGSMLFGMSVYTNGAHQQFFSDRGWRELLSFEQFLYRVDETTAIYGSYSVDPVDARIIKQAWFEETGIIIDQDLTDTWLDYSTIMEGTFEDCDARVRRFRERVYRLAGDTNKRYPLEKIFAINKQASDEVFYNLYLSMAVARATGIKTSELHAFAQGMLRDPDALSREAYIYLSDIYKRDTITKDDVSVLEQAIRYSLAVHCCEGLKQHELNEETIRRVLVEPLGAAAVGSHVHINIGKLTGAALVGARRGDTFGGCTKDRLRVGRNGKKTKKNSSDLDDPLEELSLHAEEDGEESGSDDESTWKLKFAVCRTDNCPSRGANPEEPKKAICGPCDICMDWCQPFYRLKRTPKWRKKKNIIKMVDALQKNKDIQYVPGPTGPRSAGRLFSHRAKAMSPS